MAVDKKIKEIFNEVERKIEEANLDIDDYKYDDNLLELKIIIVNEMINTCKDEDKINYLSMLNDLYVSDKKIKHDSFSS